MTETLRLFVALPVPEPAARALAVWTRAEVDPAWRPVATESLHVTLVFIGRTGTERLEAIGAAMREACAPARALILRPTSVRRLGSVLAAPLAAEDDQAVAALALAQHDLAGRLERREARAWLPHLTLARVRGRGRPPLPAGPPPPLALAVSEVVLYASELARGGARYRRLAAVPLK